MVTSFLWTYSLRRSKRVVTGKKCDQYNFIQETRVTYIPLTEHILDFMRWMLTFEIEADVYSPILIVSKQQIIPTGGQPQNTWLVKQKKPQKLQSQEEPREAWRCHVICHLGDPITEDKGTASDSREMWMGLDESNLQFCEEKKVKDWPPSLFPSVLVSQVSLVLLKNLFS